MQTYFHRTMPVLVLLLFLSPASHAQQYRFDTVHTQILFFVDHLGFSKSQGEFLKFDGGFDFSRRDFSRSKVAVTIQADSLDMDDEKWNKHMKSKDYFHVEKFPAIEFHSTRVEATGENKFDIHGDLTMLGVSRPIVIHTRFNKTGVHLKTGDHVAGFSATASLQRSQWGMKRGIPFVGDDVELRIEVEGVFQR